MIIDFNKNIPSLVVYRTERKNIEDVVLELYDDEVKELFDIGFFEWDRLAGSVREYMDVMEIR